MNNRLIPGPLLIFIDILLTGAALCVFAYFHHVRPSASIVDVRQIEENNNSSSSNNSGEDSSSNNNSGNDSNDNNDSSNDNNDSSTDNNNSDSNDSGGNVSSEFTDFTSQFGKKFTTSSKYTDNTYSGPNSYVEVKEVREDGVTYFVQDIYLRSVEYLRTAFAEDSYGKSIADWPLNIAKNNNAVCAVNGDYYGIHDVGLVIRNGYAYRKTLTNNTDLCIIYKNGEMITYSENELDVDKAISAGAYQAWSFGPELVVDGSALTSFGNNRIAQENPRTGIGYYEPGHYCFVTVDGRNANDSSGLTLKGFAQLFSSLGCKGAYNLDGGKSSAMTFNDSLVNEPSDGGRESSDIVYICE